MQKILLLLFGFSIALIQLLFFREILPVFQGIDIVAGFFAAHTFITFAIGFYSASILKLQQKSKNTILLNVILLLILPLLSFIFIRSIRTILNIPIGGGISLKTTFIYIFLAVCFINFFQGTLLFSLIHLIKTKYRKISLNNLFFYQSIGFILCGITYSYLFYSFSGTKIILLFFMTLVISIFLLIKDKKSIVIVLTSLILFLSVFFSHWIIKIDKKILNKNFSNTFIEECTYSPYGQIILIQKNNEYHLLSNNILLFSSPDNNIIKSEDFGHIPILHHQNPKNILLIGGAVKYLPMLLEHKIDNIDYVETDNAITESIKHNIFHLGYVFNDKRVSIYNNNAREFIKQKHKNYDLILIGLPAPLNLYLNSYYTKEFFEISEKSLNKDGFLALMLPGKMVFAPSITTELNKSVIDSLYKVFKNVRIIPGSNNIIIAAQNSMPYRMLIKRQLLKVQKTALVLSRHYIDDKMDTEKTNWFTTELEKIDDQDFLNTINNPQAAMLTLLYEQSSFSPYLSVFLDKISQYSYIIIAGIIFIFFLSKSIYKTTAFACGSTAFWLNFTAVYTLQSYTGQIYQWLGLIISLFVLGLILGNVTSNKIFKHIALNKKTFLTELLFLILTGMWFVVCNNSNIIPLYILLFASGFTTGLEFSFISAISKLYHDKTESRLKIFLYGIFGVWISSLLGGGFLILSWGTEKSILFILFLKFLIFCRWADLKKRGL
jgi:spermidine synthase